MPIDLKKGRFMKRATLGKISEALEKIMFAKDISAKELAQKSGICYSSLAPILNGSRDFGVSKLIAIANALECNPDTLLEDLFNIPQQEDLPEPTKPEHIASFISVTPVTYCKVYEVETKKTTTTVFHFPLRCGQDPEEFIYHVVTAIQNLSGSLTKKINNKDTAVFVSVQQYEGATNRRKTQKKGDQSFSKFIIESDAITNYRALLGDKNGICITINEGDAIIYSTDKAKSFKKLQGYGFPISDVAGNCWLGCEALKHAIDVREGLEPSSLLSDKVLALFNDDINLLSEYTLTNPDSSYVKASAIVKELVHMRDKSYDIVKQSYELLMKRIAVIDKETKTKLPIAVAGGLAHIYESFFPNGRTIKFADRHNTVLLDYGIKTMQKAIKDADK